MGSIIHAQLACFADALALGCRVDPVQLVGDELEDARMNEREELYTIEVQSE